MMGATRATFRRSWRGYSAAETEKLIARREEEFLAHTRRLKELLQQLNREEKILEDRIAELKKALAEARERDEGHKALFSWLDLYFELAGERLAGEKKRLEEDYRELKRRIEDEELLITREVNALEEFLLSLRQEGEALEAKLEEKWEKGRSSIENLEMRLSDLIPAAATLDNFQQDNTDAEEKENQLASPVVKGKKALVADDDPTVLAMLRVILEREGFHVFAAADGEEAARQIDEMAPPDIVVLDIMMPYMDGYQLVKKIREKKEWHKTPVVMLTANSSEQDIVKLLEAGANDYIIKPFNVRELSTRIKKLAVPSSLGQVSDACR